MTVVRRPDGRLLTRSPLDDAPGVDPRAVALDEGSGEYVGIARVWMRPDLPRLGLIGLARTHRRRGIATALLAHVFCVLAERAAWTR